MSIAPDHRPADFESKQSQNESTRKLLTSGIDYRVTSGRTVEQNGGTEIIYFQFLTISKIKTPKYNYIID